MSFLKKLFGFGGSGDGGAPAPGRTVQHLGFTIRAEPYQSEGQYQTAGAIEKEIGGELKTHRFVRADRHPSHEQAVEFALAKGRQIIDEQGERLFG